MDATDNAGEAGSQAPPRAVARVRHLRVAPMKARRVVELIKGRTAQEALAVLEFSPQTASRPVAKVLASAMANAENNLDLDPQTLVVRQAYVDEGTTWKRFRPRAQGRAYRIRKRTSHITVEVESVPRRKPTRSRKAGSSSSSSSAGANEKGSAQ